VIRVGECNFAAITKRLESMPEVRTAYNITGSDSWLLEVALRDVAHLDALLWTLKEFGETSTTIILRSVREHAPLRPAAATAQAMAAGAARIKSRSAARSAATSRKTRHG
jgi:Lrp/AsnC family leucine-responsive transcriptional regulator